VGGFERLHTVVTCAALLMFAWLTVRHVGEAAFLEDQVDQLQNFESLLGAHPEGFWGGTMSGTVPPARALGPLGAVVFGVPVALGLGIDSIHLTTSLLIAIATAIGFVALSRIDLAFAWLWLLVFSATGVVWWNAGMLWTNTLLLPLGLLLTALTAECLRHPRRSMIGWLIVTGLFALQLHLVAVVGVTVIAMVIAVTFRQAQPLPRMQTWVLGIAALVALGPYVVGEALSGFANTRAIVSYAGSASGPRDSGAAAMALAIGLDPMRLLDRIGLGVTFITVIGAASTIAAVRLESKPRARELFWLTACAPAAVAGQAIFFWWTARPFAGYHHVTLLAPFYAVVPAVLLKRALFTDPISTRTACGLGAAVLVLLIVIGPSIADRNVEATPWSFTRIRATLDALCGTAAVDTDEGQGFAARLNPQYDSVLRYMMRRQMTTCRYQPSSDVLIAAARDGDYPREKTIGQTRYLREIVLPPGIARYRRDR
jgi:hypothetical protein